MSENAKNTTVEKKETTVEKPVKKPAAKPAAEKKGENPEVKEKKEGFVTRAKNWAKRNKNALIAGAAGVATGVAGTIGVSEIGRRTAERRARRNQDACIPQDDHSPLDPNY